MPSTNQKGIAQILVVMLLFAGIALAVYLVQVRQIFHSRAVSDPISGPISGPISPPPSSSPSPIPGDIVPPGGNNKVDIFDYNQLLSDFGKSGSGLISDIVKNDRVDIFDYNLLLSNFGKSVP